MSPEPSLEHHDVVVVGAGPAGLAVAAGLAERGLEHVVLEASDRIATPWRNHYRRLHLHTPKARSTLPGRRFPRHVERYPAREDVVTYLVGYASQFGIRPRFGEQVQRVARDERGGWEVTTGTTAYRSRSVVVATGYAHTPHLPDWPGREEYTGELLHSSRYRDGSPWRDQDVLVVGFGNSACEIAIDLYEHGARPDLSVRGGVNVVPRDLLGLPVLTLGTLGRRLPPKLADGLFAPLIRLSTGGLGGTGLQPLPYGPMEQIQEHGRVPLLDIGTVDLIRDGAIRVRPEIERFAGAEVEFVDGERRSYGAVVAGTGYRPGLESFLDAELAHEVLDARGGPTSGAPGPIPGLYFCGFYVSPSGMLHEIALEAGRIADDVAHFVGND